MNNLCTIIIPTYNRPDRLKRLLDYYNKYRENFNIIIADSSSSENKVLNKKNVSMFAESNIQYLDNYSFKINPSRKLKDALNYVNTKYTVFCADDDFITPNGINQSVTFLGKNPDFSCAHGHGFTFSLECEDKREQKYSCTFPTYLDKSITFPEAEARLASHLANYQLPMFYAVHRTDLLKMIFKDTVQYTDDDQFVELLSSMLALIYGKMKHMNVLYCARERTSSLAGNTRKSIGDFMKNRTYKKKYTKFRECLVGHLIKNSHLNNDGAEELIDKAMSKYLKKYHSGRFKGILIDKMRNLLNALDLPEYIDKNIRMLLRMLYRKMFTPEINDFKNTIKSPNSKYFNDFNKIRNHVLLGHIKH